RRGTTARSEPGVCIFRGLLEPVSSGPRSCRRLRETPRPGPSRSLARGTETPARASEPGAVSIAGARMGRAGNGRPPIGALCRGDQAQISWVVGRRSPPFAGSVEDSNSRILKPANEAVPQNLLAPEEGFQFLDITLGQVQVAFCRGVVAGGESAIGFAHEKFDALGCRGHVGPHAQPGSALLPLDAIHAGLHGIRPS